MILIERKADLFLYEKTHYLVQCISADLEMGRGIAVSFNSRYSMKSKLTSKYGSRLVEWENTHGEGILEENVINLITKEYYWHKPTYETMERALQQMSWIIESNSITRVAMPKIGCGLDRLEWSKVRVLITKTFDHFENLEIIVCEPEIVRFY